MLPKLESIGAQELMEEVLKPPVWLVEGLLPTSSTNLLCSPPKFGKSILCLQLCQSVAMGQPFLEKATVGGCDLSLPGGHQVPLAASLVVSRRRERG